MKSDKEIKMLDDIKKKGDEKASLKLKHPIQFFYLEATNTGNKVDGIDEIDFELKAKELKTYGDVLNADKLEKAPNRSIIPYEKQLLWELVYQLLI